MSALTVYDALEAAFLTVDGLNTVILGEPTAIHDPPALYTALSGWRRVLPGTSRSVQSGIEYTFTHRLIIRWQDNQEAERELLSLVDSIPAAINADPHLSSALNAGKGTIEIASGGFVTISGTLYRIVDYTSTVLEKVAVS